MHQQFYKENAGLYCKLFEDNEETFVLTFYKAGKHVNAVLSEMSKECREDLYHYMKEKYDLIKNKFPLESDNHPIYVELNGLLNNFCRKTGYNVALTNETRYVKEDFVLPEERMTLDYLVLKELSNKHYITKKGVLVKRETK